MVVLFVVPFATSAEEWRFCMGGDQVEENLRAPLMFTHVFRSDLVPEYEQQIATHLARKLTITGEVTVGCTDPYPTKEAATDKMIDWLDLMTNGDVAMEVISARWEPVYQAAPESARQATNAAISASQSQPLAVQDAPPEAAVQQTAASTEVQHQANQRQEGEAEQRRQYWEQQRVASTGTGPGTKPLRFRLMISMLNLPGDAHNSMCYSNIITRPGPPGWGTPVLPTGSAGQANQTIESFKAAFIAKCRAASGREITGEGNFVSRWNQTEDDESRLGSMGARFQEDVTVQMD